MIYFSYCVIGLSVVICDGTLSYIVEMTRHDQVLSLSATIQTSVLLLTCHPVGTSRCLLTTIKPSV